MNKNIILLFSLLLIVLSFSILAFSVVRAHPKCTVNDDVDIKGNLSVVGGWALDLGGGPLNNGNLGKSSTYKKSARLGGDVVCDSGDYLCGLNIVQVDDSGTTLIVDIICCEL